MNKGEKHKIYTILINTTLAAACIVEAFGSADTAPQPSKEQIKYARIKKAMQAAKNELARPEYSILKVETILQNLVNDEEFNPRADQQN